jgi:RHS repeat-associated protein
LEHLSALRWQRLVRLGTGLLAVRRGAVSVSPDGTPLTYSRGPVSLDLGFMPLGLFPTDGVMVSTVGTLELLGSQGSFVEGEALGEVFAGDHITGVTFLTRAVREGQTLTKVDGDNVDAVLDAVELSADAEDSVRAGLDRGLIAWVPESQLLVETFDTSGYALEDPATGAAGYFVTFERLVQGLAANIEFHSPRDLDVVTAPIDVVATIESEQLESWTLSYQMVGEGPAMALAYGQGPVTNSTLAKFDPTLLLNGLYDIVLTGRDLAGQSVAGRISVVVEGGMKIGHFALSFIDLEVELAGIPIQIVRSYDSRRKDKVGDFGHGWTLDIRQGSYRSNRPIGQGWEVREGFLPCQAGVETKSHLVTVRLSDREIYRFKLVLNRTGLMLGGCFGEMGLDFVDGPQPGASLTFVGNLGVFWANASDQLVDLDSLEPFEPTAVRLTLRDGRIFEVDRVAGITRIEDANGNELTISDGAISHSAGISINVERDAEGRIERIGDLLGQELTYAYDPAGDLVGFTDRDQATTTFAYLDHYLETIVDPLGRTPIRNEYDADGRLTKHVDAYGREILYDHLLEANQEIVTNRLGKNRLLEYDQRGNVIRETNEEGEVTRRTFDGKDNVLTETDPLGQVTTNTYQNETLTSTTDPLGHVTRFSYNSRGDLLSVTDALGHVTTNVSDSAGNLTKTTDAQGHETTYSYNSAGNVLTETDDLGQVTTNVYNGRGQITQTTNALGQVMSYAYDGQGNRLSETTTRTLANGAIETLTTSYAYDGQQRQIQTTAADGSITRTEYDDSGQVKATVDALGRRTTFEYDDLGRQTKTTHPDGLFEERSYDAEGRLVSSKDRAGRAATYTYDDAGRLLGTRYTDNTTTARVYDDTGRLITSIDARGKSTTYEYDEASRRKKVINALGDVTEFFFDEAGNQTSVKDAKGHTITFDYDTLNRQVGTVFADGSETSTAYDNLGRRISETDQAGKITQFGYDALGRLTRVTAALNQVTSYAYDEAGNRTSQTDANGRITRFDYDRLGRQIKRILPGGAFETFVYDTNGQMTSRTDFNGATVTYSYDQLNRLTGRSYPNGDQVSFTYNAIGLRQTAVDARGTTTYSYDVRNRLQALTYPDGRSLDYTYDSNGNRQSLIANVGSTSLTTTYAYDDLNRLQIVTDPEGRNAVYGYDPNGNRESLTYANGVVTSYVYDPLNRLRDITAISGMGAVVASFAYTLGASGNRTKIVEHDGTTKDYGYDDLYRLTTESVTLAAALRWSNGFGYDPVGNRQTQNRVEVDGATRNLAYTYDHRDRLTVKDTVNYDWDHNGNLISKSGTDWASYEWNFDNRLAKVTLSNGMTVEHVYDVDGTRVKTVTTPSGGPAETVEYLVDTSGGLSQVVLEGSTTTSVSSYYVRGDDLISVIRPQAGGPSVVRNYHADGLGSIRALTDAAGGVADTWQFEAFGTLVAHTGSDPNAYLFAGEMLDPNVGWSYNRARWMDPSVGRFGSMDSFAGRLLAPISLHKYLYSPGNPVDFVDPSGLQFSAVGLSASMAIGGMINGMFGAVFSNHSMDSKGFWKEFGQNVALGALTAPVGGPIAKAFGAIAKLTMRPFLSLLGSIGRITLRGKGPTGKMIVNISRQFFNTNLAYPGVKSTFFGRALVKLFPRTQWEQHHVFIQQAWTRVGGPNQMFADLAANEGLRRIGNSMLNLLPIPRSLNGLLGRSPVGTQLFATAYYSILAYGPYHTLANFLGDDGGYSQ